MSRSHRIWFPVGFVALIVLGVVAGIMPRLRTIDRLDQEAASLADRAHRADNGAAEIARLQERLTAAKTVATGGIKNIPADNDIAGLIRQLTSRLDQLGMAEREITTGSIEDLGDAFAAPMTVRMKGPFLGVQDAVEWLESLPRLVRILRIKVETPRRSAADRLAAHDAAVEAELILNVFFDANRIEPGESVAAADSEDAS